MVEPTGHCPYLGLKQNQAIRFASPTPEHRCYSAGQAQEIPSFEPNYQSSYCLSPNHIKCPLYTGSGLPSTPLPPPPPPRLEPALATAGGGLRGWLAGLAPRDRAIYGLLVGLLGLILLFYAVAGIGLASGGALFGGWGFPPAAPAPTDNSGQLPVGLPSPSPTDEPPSATATDEPPSVTATRRPTRTPRPAPSATPTSTPTEAPLPTLEAITFTPTLYIPPPPTFTFVPEPPTNTPSDLLTVTPEPPTAEPSSTSTAATEAPTLEPSSTTEAPTLEPSSTTEAPTEAPAPTEGPTPEPARTESSLPPIATPQF